MNRETLRKFQIPLMLALMLYPVCALGLGYADMELLKWRWLLPRPLVPSGTLPRTGHPARYYTRRRLPS